MEHIKAKKNHQYGVCQLADSSPFPTSVHENSFIIARDINIVVIIAIITVHMDDAFVMSTST